MNARNNMFFMITMLICSAGSLWSMYYPERPEDYIIVDAIQKESDITRTDVERWKLLWMDRFAEPSAVGAGVYGMVQGGRALSAAHEYMLPAKGVPASGTDKKIENVLTTFLVPLWERTPEVITNIVTSKAVWAGVGVAGAGWAAYQLLYPRIRRGIEDKIKRYVELCEKLAVTTVWYGSLDDLRQGSGDAGQTVWYVGDAIAINNGLYNLREQGQWALLLLDQLDGHAATRKAILSTGSCLTHNINAIQGIVKEQITQRVEEEKGMLSRRSEQLNIEKTQSDITSARIKNVTSMWKTLQDAAEFGIKHKEVIGGTVAGAWVYSKYSNLFSK